MTAAQLAAFRSRVQGAMEDLFPATMVVGAQSIEVAATRGMDGAEPELAGLLATAELTVRVRRARIPEGVEFVARRTAISIGSKSYRVEQVGDDPHDPAITLKCKAA